MSEDWLLTTLGEIVEISSGTTPRLSRDAKYPVMGANGKIGTSDNFNFSGGYLLGRVGAAGAVARVQRKCWASDNTLTITPLPGLVDDEYLGWLLRGADIPKLATQTAQPLITQTQVRGLQVTMPPLPEQRRIAEILDTLDDQVRATQQIIAKLRIAKQGILTELLTRGIEHDGRLRDPIASPDDFKPSRTGSIPKTWREDFVGNLISSGDLIDIQDGNHGESHPKRNDFVNEGVPFLMARDLSDGSIDLDHCYKIRREQYAGLRVGFSKSGDVLLSHKGTIGEVAIVPDDTPEVMLTPQVTYYRCAGGLSSEFLFFYMQSDLFQRMLRTIAGQSTRDYVGITAQRRLLSIRVPDRYEQQRIVSIASGFDSRVENEKARLGKLHLTRTGLMSDLLTGRVRVPLGATS